MLKKIAAFLGLLLLMSGVILGLKLNSEEKKAVAKDNKKTIFAIVGDDSPPACNWEVKEPERVMTENTSQAVVVNTVNPEKGECEIYLSLRAPGFDVEPSNGEQKINLKSGDKGSISWIISPRKTGDYTIALSDIINTKTFGINITNMFGLNAFQAKIASIIGSLFGPMFTIPWWWDRLKKKKQPER